MWPTWKEETLHQTQLKDTSCAVSLYQRKLSIHPITWELVSVDCLFYIHEMVGSNQSHRRRGDTFSGRNTVGSTLLQLKRPMCELHIQHAEKIKNVRVTTKYSVCQFCFVDSCYAPDFIFAPFLFVEGSEAPLMLTWTWREKTSVAKVGKGTDCNEHQDWRCQHSCFLAKHLSYFI